MPFIVIMTMKTSSCLYDIPILKENDTNFQTWKYQICTVLDIRGLFNIAKGKEQHPSQILMTGMNNNTTKAHTAQIEKIKDWDHCNKEAKVQITLTLSDVIAYGHEGNGLFIFDGTTCLPEKHANITILSDLKLVNDSVEEKMDEPPQKKSTDSLTMWYKRLEYVAKATVKKLSKKQMVKGMEIDEHDDEDETYQCSTCLKGKMTQQPIPKVSDIENPCIFHHIYSNICGPMQKMAQDGHRYFMTFIDGHSRYIKVELLKTKDEAVEKLIALIECAEVETGKQVNYFQSNGGDEYSSGRFAKYLKLKEIHHEFTNPDTPQKNGVAERANCTLVYTA